MPRIGLMLSPYRNLTTLACAALALHPHIQVMNHGFARIESEDGLKFITDGKAESLDHFCGLLIRLSEGGRQGDYGGSILHSHAFEHDGVMAAYQRLVGDAQIKPVIQAVVWKESGRLREHLKEFQVSPLDLAAKFDQLYFISPVRNLLDHAYGLQKFYATLGLQSYVRRSLADVEIDSILRYIIACHLEFWNYSRAMPTRFFMFGENEMNGKTLHRLGRFLGVDPISDWIRNASPLFISKNHYEHLPGHEALLQQLLAEIDDADFLKFINDGGASST